MKAIGSKKQLMNTDFYDCIKDIVHSDELGELKSITHHISTTRFQHCLNVSYYNWLICRKLRLDAKSAARAGLLHDLFYYDRKEYNFSKKNDRGAASHSLNHSRVALENAKKLAPVNDCESDIIEKHMFPVTKKLPRYKESYVIVFTDKYCAMLEYFIPKLRRLKFGVSRKIC